MAVTQLSLRLQIYSTSLERERRVSYKTRPARVIMHMRTIYIHESSYGETYRALQNRTQNQRIYEEYSELNKKDKRECTHSDSHIPLLRFQVRKMIGKFGF